MIRGRLNTPLHGVNLKVGEGNRGHQAPSGEDVRQLPWMEAASDDTMIENRICRSLELPASVSSRIGLTRTGGKT